MKKFHIFFKTENQVYNVYMYILNWIFETLFSVIAFNLLLVDAYSMTMDRNYGIVVWARKIHLSTVVNI